MAGPRGSWALLVLHAGRISSLAAGDAATNKADLVRYLHTPMVADCAVLSHSMGMRPCPPRTTRPYPYTAVQLCFVEDVGILYEVARGPAAAQGQKAVGHVGSAINVCYGFCARDVGELGVTSVRYDRSRRRVEYRLSYRTSYRCIHTGHRTSYTYTHTRVKTEICTATSSSRQKGTSLYFGVARR
eukprot:5682153-Prymnesium_polylepis.2